MKQCVPVGQPEMSCLLWITAVSGQAAWVCKLPGALRGRCFWNSEQLFGCLGSLGLELMGTWRHGQEGEGQAWCAKYGLLGATPGDFPRPDPDTAEGARWPVSWGEPASDGVTWTGVLASLAQETTGHGGSLLHMVSAHHIVPMQPGVWMRVGSLHCPSRYVNKGKKMSSQKPRVPQLETWSSRCGWGGGGNISDGWVGAKGGLSPRAQPAFTGSSKSPGLYSVLVLSENRSQP